MIKECYCGSIRELKKLLQTSSGGAATILAEEFIKNGGLVIGVKWASDYKSCLFKLAKNISDLDEIIGTKYLSPKYKIEIDGEERELFPYIKKILESDEKILFFGLGCCVGSLLLYLNQKKVYVENLYTIDILCHGPALDDVHLKYVDELERKAQSKLVKLNHRYKKEKWMPKYIKADFENGKTIIEKFNDTTFGVAFHEFAKPQCSNCHYKGESHQGDVCLGDYWGSNRNIEGYNDKGTSIIFIQTEKGKTLLDLLKKSRNFELIKTDYEFAVKNNPMYVNSRESKGNLHKFEALLKKHSLKKSLRRVNLVKHFKQLIKKPFSHLRCVFSRN